MQQIIANVEQVTGIPLSTIQSYKRQLVISDARAILTWELMIAGHDMKDIAKLINKSLVAAYQCTYRYRDYKNVGEFKEKAENVTRMRK